MSRIAKLLTTFVVIALIGALAPVAASAQESDENVVGYSESAMVDLEAAAAYLDLNPQEFIEVSVIVHGFLLTLAGQVEVSGACGVIDGIAYSGEDAFLFEIPSSPSLELIQSFYCASAADAAYASTTLMVFIAGVARMYSPPTECDIDLGDFEGNVVVRWWKRDHKVVSGPVVSREGCNGTDDMMRIEGVNIWSLPRESQSDHGAKGGDHVQEPAQGELVEYVSKPVSLSGEVVLHSITDPTYGRRLLVVDACENPHYSDKAFAAAGDYESEPSGC